MTPNTDLRVMRTRKMLRDALVDLVEEKGFDAVTVTDIAERAMINRATFYRHYQDKYDLLERCMDDVIEEMVKSSTPGPDVLEQIERGLPLRNVYRLFEHLAEHARLYRVLLGQAGAFAARMRAYLVETIGERLEIMRPYANNAPVPEGVSLSFIASAYLGAAIWWLENGQPYSPQQMAKYLFDLTVYGTYHAFGWDAERVSGITLE